MFERWRNSTMPACIKTVGVYAVTAAIMGSYYLLDYGPVQKLSTSYPITIGALVVCFRTKSKTYPLGLHGVVRGRQRKKFDLHTDWFARPRVLDQGLAEGRTRLYNRVATFFAVLECEGCPEEGGVGETWFPRIEAPANPDESV
ncbi:hypothetical protein MCOR04_009031 [Pyricularia oryzae]|nr:hypothetical protein MCOR13_007974 [Pyricularia oryzae]KAI6564818.1 hypothetical protein MCOR04_009031 [Pyricularia oryzae]